MSLKLGTRGSDLARTQSTTVAERLTASGYPTELELIRTAGDQSNAPSFASIGPQGVFVREIEQALLDRRVDLAVHSYKDLPTQSPPELGIGAIPERFDPADVLVARESAVASAADGLIPLADGARVGTASARRRVWLEHLRPDLAIEPLRGNVPTRLKRLRERRFDAILLAAAGIERLQAGSEVLHEAFDGLVILRLDPERFVPAPAQGALAVQYRRADDAVRAALAPLDHAPTRAAIAAERDVLARAEGGCDIAFGAYCRPVGERYELIAMLERDGRIRSTRVRHEDPTALGALAWGELDGQSR